MSLHFFLGLISRHHKGCILSDIGLSCSVRGGEGAFEEVKGGDKQVSLRCTLAPGSTCQEPFNN